MRSCYFKVGDMVQSHYRSPWTGVVLDVTRRKDKGALLLVRVVLDGRGRPAPKATRRRLKHYAESWFTLVHRGGV